MQAAPKIALSVQADITFQAAPEVDGKFTPEISMKLHAEIVAFRERCKAIVSATYPEYTVTLKDPHFYVNAQGPIE